MYETPYIEICNCCNEDMVWVNFSGSSKHEAQYDTMVSTALQNDYDDPYVYEYEDGTFIKEYSSTAFELTVSSDVLSDGSFAYEFMLMRFTSK